MELDQNHIKNFYNSVPNVWGNNDCWHEYSQKIISSYIAKRNFFRNSTVLNAGSAGNSYNIDCKLMFHVDIADEKIKNLENSYVASIEELPFNDGIFDNIICVGSVLNYCDAMSSISELSRVLKDNGNLILEFESSWGYEYLRSENYKKDTCIITTEYIEKKHKQWLYSPQYIYKLLNFCGLKIIHKQPFHIADGIISQFMNDKKAVICTNIIDKFIAYAPFVKNHGNNIIMHCCKTNS